MIYLVFGLLLCLLWYLADKNLKGQFLPYLKWPALIFALFFVGYDIYYNIQLERIIHIDEDHADGIKYSYYDNVTNTTNEVKLYALQGTDRGEVFSFFKAEQGMDSFLGSIMADVLYLCIFGLIVQYLSILYDRYQRGSENGE